MHVQAKQRFELVDGEQHELGRITVERTDKGSAIGEFTAGPSFASIQELFRDYEQAADLQALSVIDELDARIAALGLSVVLPNGRRVPLRDVQIWSDGGISFRLDPEHQEILELIGDSIP